VPNLEYVRQLAKGTAALRLGGIVYDDLSFGSTLDALRLKGATVVLNGAMGRRTTTTDSEGRYSFEDVAPGQYNLRILFPPYRAKLLAGDTTVKAGTCGWADFGATAPGVLQGRVIDEKGGPLQDAFISVDRLDAQQRRISGKQARSDSAGFYRFEDMPAGDFLVGGRLRVHLEPGQRKTVPTIKSSSIYVTSPDRRSP
jgi:hypothetical protein